MEVSCLQPNPPITPGGSCVSQFENGLATGFGILFGPTAADIQRYVDCAARASDCTTALTCASRNHGPSYCAAHPGGSCDGDLRVYCASASDWDLYPEDCSLVGEHCRAANGSSSCTDGNSCDPMTPAHCDGSRLVTCDSTTHLESSIDCSNFASGWTCGTTVSGSSTTTGCMPKNSGGCQNGPDRCDGAAAVVCDSGLSLRIECGQFDSHCVITNGKFECAPNASDCTAQSPDRCNGAALEMCVNGRYQDTACASFGLASCATTMSGASCR
jgi:hypothetical protein